MKEKSTAKKFTLRTLFLGIIPLFVLAHFSHHLLSAMISPLLPFIRDDFHIDYTQAGWLLSAFTLAYGASQVPAGWLADRTSPRLLIIIGVSGAAVAGLFAGLAPTYVMLAAFLILLGIMGGGYHPASSPLVSASVPAANRGSALGLHQIGGTSSYFLAPLIVVAVAGTLGWRGSFVALSIPVIIIGVVLYIILGKRGFTGEGRKNKAAAAQVETPKEPGRWRRLLAFIVMNILTHSVIVAVISFVPLVLVDHFGISNEAAAGLSALPFLAGLWAGPMGGFLSDRVGTVPLILVTSLLAGPILYFMGPVSYGWALFAVLLGLGMSQYIRMPVQEAYIINHTAPGNRSTVLGFYYFGTRGGPGLVTPLLGFLTDKYGFINTFTMAGAAVVAVTLISVPFLWGKRN